MQRVILLRHAKTEAVSASGADADRALTERGRRDAELMGRLLAQTGLAPDLALVSAARRARETWDLLSASFPLARRQIDDGLYLASAERLAHVVDADSEPDTCLMIVGHNPGLHELALTYARHGPDQASLVGGFPTAAAAVFSRSPHDDWSLEQMLTPRDHRAASS